MQIGPITLEVPTLLAPMADVTDISFRTVCEEHGVGITITEFLSANALSANARAIVERLTPSLGGRRFGAQIFGRDPAILARGAEMAVSAGAALVDINMGCPSKRVIAGESGVALMREPAVAQELVRVVRRAVPSDVPVTVKHRAGWDDRERNAPEFAAAMVEAGAAMITVHGRTRAQGFSGEADLGIIAAVRAALPARVPVVGNGDVVDVEGYRRMRGETGCDGVMIGRGAMGNPFLFARIRAVEAGLPDPGPPDARGRAAAFDRHAGLALAHVPAERHFLELRKIAAWYSRGVRGGASFRASVGKTRDPLCILELAAAFFAA